MPRRKVEDSDIGLQVLYEASNPRLDIVAVHGIGAHREETWSAPVDLPEGGREWLNWLSHESMLRRVIPDIRVLNFGYKSDWFGSPVRLSLSSLGSLLWTSLNMCREGCQERPIIFVAHCFGGLIVMRVLTERSQHTIAQATAGIAFLGTPFRGTDERFHAELPRMAEANIGQVDDRILHYLRRDNSTLEDLVDDFLDMRMRGNNPDRPRVACFYECLSTQVNKIVNDPNPLEFIVVDKGSAHLDRQRGIEKHAFQRDHFQLNKFKSPTEGDFQLLCEVLKRFTFVAATEIQPLLATVAAERQDSIAQAQFIFQSFSWREAPLTIFNYEKRRTEIFKIKREKKFNPLASGISLDCRHMFLRDDYLIRIYSVEDIERSHIVRSIRPDILTIDHQLLKSSSKSQDQEIQGVSIGLTVCVSITKKSCWIHRFVGKKECQVVRRLSNDNTWNLRCVAVSETTLKDDLIVIALGMQQDIGGRDCGEVELISIWQNDWGERTRIQTMELKDCALGITDSPKTLTFSLDGATLTCTTQRENQVHGWQLPTAEAVRKIKKICETTRPFNTGVNAKGITSATTWMSPEQHPYVLCTTSPSTERENDGGEWSFIAPLSIPFVNWATERAYHCLRQVQGADSPHLHIHASAITPQGNFLALLDSNGYICMIPIHAKRSGGMVTKDSDLIEVKETLGKNEGPMATLRFNPLGTKLYGTNWNGHLVVVKFPSAIPAAIRPYVHRVPTLASQASPSQQYSKAPSPSANLPPKSQNDNRNLLVRGSPTCSSNHSISDASTYNISEGSKEFSTSPLTGLGVSLAFEDSKHPSRVSQSPPVSKIRRLSTWGWPLKHKNTESDKTDAVPTSAVRPPYERPLSPSEAKLE